VAAVIEAAVELPRIGIADARSISWRGQIETWVTRGTPIRRMLEFSRESDPPYGRFGEHALIVAMP
jgi:hypothetical protein